MDESLLFLVFVSRRTTRVTGRFASVLAKVCATDETHERVQPRGFYAQHG